MDHVKYKNFDILIQNRENDVYPTRVLSSPAGETRGVLAFSSLVPDVITNLKSLRDLVLDVAPQDQSEMERWAHATRFGELLFDALMSGEVRSCFDVSLNLRGKDGLRIRLRIEPPELSALPWELMRDKRSGSFVSLSNLTPVVRYIELQQASPPLVTRKPLCVLVVISSPTDMPQLNVEAEISQLTEDLRELVKNGDLNITVLREASLLALQKQLRKAEYNVLHYIGHGHFSEEDGEGYLVFENNQGRSQFVSGGKLGPLLHDEETLRLTVLNACSTSVSAEAKPFSGVATSLVQAGIPAVVAMQTAVTDDAALQFSQAFYQAIADGCPIDYSVSEARKSIDSLAGHTVEWAIPELFMRVADGMLFDFDSGTSEAASSVAPRQAPESDLALPASSPDQPSRVSNSQPLVEPEPVRTEQRVNYEPARSSVSEPVAAQLDSRMVTNEEFKRFVEATRARAPSTWQRGGYPFGANRPVTGVSWHQAAAYATWAGKRLPSMKELNQAAGKLERLENLWEWAMDEVNPRGLGRKEKKRALYGGPSVSERSSITSAWPEEELDYIGFRCAISIKENP